MAYEPMQSTTDHHRDTQESMFEHATSLQADEMNQDTPEPSYESAEAFPDEHSEKPKTAFQAESQPAELNPDSEAGPAVAAEAQPLALLTVDDFAALEERVLLAVGLVRRERQARAAAEERAVEIQVKLQESQLHVSIIDELQQEVLSLRTEREQVRQRVERLLGQLDALEL